MVHSPFPSAVVLVNDTPHTLLTPNDLVDLIRCHMGDDLASFVDDLFEPAEEFCAISSLEQSVDDLEEVSNDLNDILRAVKEAG